MPIKPDGNKPLAIASNPRNEKRGKTTDED
jgi:hypothetical protein